MIKRLKSLITFVCECKRAFARSIVEEIDLMARDGEISLEKPGEKTLQDQTFKDGRESLPKDARAIT